MVDFLIGVVFDQFTIVKNIKMNFFKYILFVPLFVMSQQKASVFVFSGQSNMWGTGKIKDLNEDYTQPLKEVYAWDIKTKTFKPFKTPNRFGPEVGFVYGYRQLTDEPIYIIKFAKSGQPLHHGMDDNIFVADDYVVGRKNFYPGKKSNDKIKGKWYLALEAHMAAAQKYLKAQNIDTTIDAMFWMQGEADSKFEISAKAYDISLKNLFKRVKEDTNTKHFPFIYGKILPNDNFNPKFKFRSQVHQHLMALDKSRNSMHMVIPPADRMKSDLTHYLSYGYIHLGLSYAIKLSEIENKEVSSLVEQQESLPKKKSTKKSKKSNK